MSAVAALLVALLCKNIFLHSYHTAVTSAKNIISTQYNTLQHAKTYIFLYYAYSTFTDTVRTIHGTQVLRMDQSISYFREIWLTNREKRKIFEVISVVCLRKNIPLFLSIMLNLSPEGNITLLPTASAERPIISSSNRSLQTT